MKDIKEYYITEHYDSIEESLKIFAKDDLIAAPGIYRIPDTNLTICIIPMSYGIQQACRTPEELRTRSVKPIDSELTSHNTKFLSN